MRLACNAYCTLWKLTTKYVITLKFVVKPSTATVSALAYRIYVDDVRLSEIYLFSYNSFYSKCATKRTPSVASVYDVSKRGQKIRLYRDLKEFQFK